MHPLAFLKKSRAQGTNRWFSTTTRTFTSSAKPSGPRYDRSKFPISKTSRAISQKGAAPFASTLRPNLTGGALPRSAGGYSLSGTGKGVRHFSHTPGAQAQVVQNVSAGIRAFFVGGGKARFNGMDPVTGEKRFRSISHTEDSVYTKWESPMVSMMGTSLVFKLNPMVTALCPSFSTLPQSLDSRTEITSLNSNGLLDTLASDFARALKDLSLILADLRRLSTFGDLPISLLTTESGPVLSVRFPGCDADLVSRLCDEVGVRRGVIIEDEGWAEGGEKDVEMALLFPFAPSTSPSVVSEGEAGAYYFDEKPFQQEKLEWQNMLSPSTPGQSLYDNTSFEDIAATLRSPALNPHSPGQSGYESLRDSDFASDDPYYPAMSPLKASSHHSYEGVEGIYKFLQVCEDSTR